MRDLRFQENPFHVLGLDPSCEGAAVQREGRKLLAQLELGLASAKTYRGALGPTERTPELVRESMAALADPDRRLVAEFWATGGRLEEAELRSELEAMQAELGSTAEATLNYLGIGSWSR
jgi:hypothetical protein